MNDDDPAEQDAYDDEPSTLVRLEPSASHDQVLERFAGSETAADAAAFDDDADSDLDDIDD